MNEPTPLTARWSTLFAAIGSAWVVVACVGGFGPLSSFTFSVAGAATLVAFGVGIRRNRPALRRGWVISGLALLLFVVGGFVRETSNTLGNLTATRPLVPDLITLPGYLMLAAGLVMLASGGETGRPDLDVILDAATAALGALVLGWVYLIDPALVRSAAPLRIKMLIVAYPTVSVFLVAILATISFGNRHPLPYRHYLLASMASLLVGDVIYTLVDSRLWHLHEPLIDLPYGLAFIAAGAAAMHPSMRWPLATPGPASLRPAGGRLVFVAVALGLPAVVSAFRPQSSNNDRMVVSLIALLLTGCAIWRVMRALRAHGLAVDLLRHQATHDVLTGLPNRAVASEYVADCLQRAASTGRVIGLLFLDVDRFKLVNDTVGHSLGDKLLVAIGGRLRSGVQSSDLVARIGGDEFIVVLDNLRQLGDAVEIADRIHDLLKVPFVVAGQEIFSSASIGVAGADRRDGGADAETLIRDADTAMYQAKAAGRDGVAVFSGSVRAEVTERIRLEGDLRHAIEREELELHYQPIVSLRTGEITGFEALVRWHHPTEGWLSPAKFVPIAEESSLVVQLGTWVLAEACRNMARWRRDLPAAARLTVAVNVSARQFRNGELLQTIRRLLADNALDAGALRVELTESMLIDSSPRTKEVLDALRQMGIGVSIDDFGTGFSSLAYLQRYPVDCVKIDKSFVDGLRQADTAEESLVAAIIAMSGALGMKTVAEGIEIPAQQEKLTALGCDFGQGWLFSAAVPPAAVPGLLARQHRFAVAPLRRSA